MTTAELLTLAPKGEIQVTGYSGRTYTFKFSWLCRLFLEPIYGPGLANITQETVVDKLIYNVLVAGLKACKANNLPDDLDRMGFYTLLDDLSETDAKKVYDAGMFSLGFTQRLIGLSEEDVNRLAEVAVQKNQPIGTPS